ncbi:hypothetical protein LOTGIDRAFT_157105 [Lottia gigantea]|uniref:Uncharacterized protein n=1 Tax=Lottia gigantea TaxID=225164 RepID=V4B3M3_LOTGI|nr:hypothetical protein LOTGIDRAFT_157105 [Lottia gigantea]ESP01971.1 hypothetical protein LOTGIDRAFT_157105 [Lottia gigantea]
MSAGRRFDVLIIKTCVSEMIVVNGIGESVSDAAIRELSDRSKRPRTPAKTSTLVITGVKRTIESTPTDESGGFTSQQRERSTPDKEKKKSSFGSALKKAFGRKKRAHSADRDTSSYKEGRYLKPPEQAYGPQSKDDLELVRAKGNASPNLKKSRSLGGSLKKLFRRSRRRSKSRDNSRDSSFKTTGSQNPSRDSSLNRSTNRSSMS